MLRHDLLAHQAGLALRLERGFEIVAGLRVVAHAVVERRHRVERIQRVLRQAQALVDIDGTAQIGQAAGQLATNAAQVAALEKRIGQGFVVVCSLRDIHRMFVERHRSRAFTGKLGEVAFATEELRRECRLRGGRQERTCRFKMLQCGRSVAFGVVIAKQPVSGHLEIGVGLFREKGQR